MGGTVPLGYDAKDKKLVINKIEAETVRYIFKRYLELQSFGKLVQDLDKMSIVTKRRDTKVKKFNGGIPFTYGPLAHFLKNRVYLGEPVTRTNGFMGSTRPSLTERPSIKSSTCSRRSPPPERSTAPPAKRC
jgi:site-specific DNA recombinase